MTTLTLTTRYACSLLTSLATVAFGMNMNEPLEHCAGRHDHHAKTTSATWCPLGRSACTPFLA